MKRNLSVLVGLVAVVACGTTWKSTGQTDFVRTDMHGDLVVEQHEIQQFGAPITKDESYVIRLDAVYPKKVSEAGGAEFLVYAEIFDRVGSSEPLVNVVFKENNQADRHILNFRNRTFFGPISFAGHPVRIRLSVVELDKEENQAARAIIDKALNVVGTFQPGTAPYLGAAKTVGNMLFAMGDDEKVIQMDFTLYPASHHMGPYLRTGYYALIKKENPKRFKKNAITGNTWESTSSSTVVLNEVGERVDTSDEDYTRLYAYDKDDDLASADGIKRVVRLRVIESQIWRQVVALEELHGPRTLLAEQRFSGHMESIITPPIESLGGEEEPVAGTKYYDVPLQRKDRFARYALKNYKSGKY
ncbi:MAG: hypothetical protein ACYTGZ_19515, partial [Planctomycetota bacterium]